MSADEEKYMKYLNENGLLPRLQEILEQLIEMDPLPTDPLLEILHAIGCPLIPQAQMKALERKVSRAQDELRYLRRVLIDLGGQDELYDSETDENEYVGHVGEIGLAPMHSPASTSYEESLDEPSTGPQYVLDAAISITEAPQGPPRDEEQPCCSRSLRTNVHQS